MNIFYLYGRSCSGKDTIVRNIIDSGGVYNRLSTQSEITDNKPHFIPTYTSREIRETDNDLITIHQDINIDGDWYKNWNFVDAQYINSIGYHNELANISIFANNNDDPDSISIYNKLTSDETTNILKSKDNCLIIGNLLECQSKEQTKYFILLSKYKKIENGELKEVYYVRYFTNMNNVFLVGDTKMLRLLEEYNKDIVYPISLLCEDKVLLNRALYRDDDVDEIIRRYLDDKKVFTYKSKVDAGHIIKLFTDITAPSECVKLINRFMSLVNEFGEY